jgi:hypothetical protein
LNIVFLNLNRIKLFHDSLQQLIALSQIAAHRPDWVQGPGGNTSVKLPDGTMLVKASGCLLKEINIDSGWAQVRIETILDALHSEAVQPADAAAMQQVSNVILQSAVQVAQPGLRPSMETAFHCLYQPFVLHTHNMYANVLLCSSGFELLEQCFSGEENYTVSLLKDYYTPGAELSWWLWECYRFDAAMPQVTFLPNHGLIIAAASVKAVQEIHDDVQFKLLRYLRINEKEYPTFGLQVDGDYCIIKSDFLQRLLRADGKRWIFEDFLFPDQLVYLHEKDYSDFDSNAKIFFDTATGLLRIRAGAKEAAAMAELMIAACFLHQQIVLRNLEPLTIGYDAPKLRGLDSEQHRAKQLLNRGGSTDC